MQTLNARVIYAVQDRKRKRKNRKWETVLHAERRT
jgi:hypothetical protein